jgi:pyridoxamine 5'-phosphate oxidase
LERLRIDDPASPAEATGPGGDFTRAADPWALFAAWMAEAEASEPNDPNAMALATAGADGLPDVRVVLLKGVDARGFVFYTNTESAKGDELRENPQAALVLHWKSLRRQVRARGPVSPVTPEEADAYFESRARNSRIGAHASRQSRPLADRATLERAVAEVADRPPARPGSLHPGRRIVRWGRLARGAPLSLRPAGSLLRRGRTLDFRARAA